MKDEDNTCLDNMKQPAAILVQILVNTSIPVSAILADTGHCQNLSIVDTGRFWEILVIPVDITGLLPLMLCTAEMMYEHELYSILLV
jgi:hypothetical protein